MTMRPVWMSLVVTGALFAPARSHAQASYDSSAALSRARTLTSAINRQDAPLLWAAFDEPMRTAMRDSANFVTVLGAIVRQTGTVDQVLGEKVVMDRGLRVYLADVRCSNIADPATLLFAFDPAGRVSGMFIRPQKPAPRHAYDSPYTQRQTIVRLRLPFEEEWTVLWGGHTIEQNDHAMTRDQRFAHDLVIQRDGSSHSGEGKKLTDYHCYGRRILAPAAGEVVWQRDSLADQAIGATDAAHAVGNAVVIDHGTGEYSLLAHLQPHSLKVRMGDKVRAGDLIGLCGNSGNSSEPHLHYHVQNGPRPLEGDGYPAYFNALVIDGKPVARAEIVKGQRVRPAPAKR
ncbi:MAG: M23 family metallopeptidase [Candidatus Eisenbacteria bacterium]